MPAARASAEACQERTPSRDLGGAILVLAIIAIMGLVFYFLHEAVQVAPVTSL